MDRSRELELDVQAAKEEDEKARKDFKNASDTYYEAEELRMETYIRSEVTNKKLYKARKALRLHESEVSND